MSSGAFPAYLDSDEADFLKVVEAVVDEKIEPAARDFEQKGSVADALGLLSESGLLLLGGSPTQGGGGARLTMFALAIQALARSSASVASVVTQNHAAAAAVLGLEGVAGEIDLGRSLRLSLIDTTSFEQGWTSQDGSSKLTGRATARNYLGDQSIFVVAVPDQDQTAVAIGDFGMHGLTVRGPAKRTGLNGDLSFELELEDVYIRGLPASQNLRRCREIVDIGTSAAAIGVAERAADVAASHVATRRQFGRALVEFGAVTQLLESMRARIQRSSSLLFTAIQTADIGEPADRESGRFSHAIASDAVVVCSDAIQLLGGYGYMQDFVVERLFRDALTLRARSHWRRQEAGLCPT